MIKAIIFDFDGTMSNRQANAYYVFDEYLKPYFTELTDIEYESVLQDMMIYDCNGTTKIAYRLAPFVNKYGKYLPEDFVEVFTQWYIDYMWKHSVLKPEATDMLVDLKKKGYKLGLLSNGSSKSQHDKIDYVDLPKYFDEVIVTGDYEFSKPDKRIYELMADKLDVKCEEMAKDKAIASGAECMFIEKYPDIVTVYTIGDISKELCGGPHVSNTKELGEFKIMKEEASSSGVRRIKAILK